tara:strand:+ start:503 stop:793 length:291 start_codon:yes stop_codon:yes gene_type:complete
MTTFWVIIGVIVVAFGAYAWYYKQGKINDADKDFIPDEVEAAVEEIKKAALEAKRRGKNVKTELKDVIAAAKELGNQMGDVGAAVKGKKRQGRKKK